MTVSAQTDIFSFIFSVFIFFPVSQLDVCRVKLLKLFQHLIIHKFPHIFDSNVGKANQSLRSYNNLVINNAIFKISLLFDIKLYIILTSRFFFFFFRFVTTTNILFFILFGLSFVLGLFYILKFFFLSVHFNIFSFIRKNWFFHINGRRSFLVNLFCLLVVFRFLLNCFFCCISLSFFFSSDPVTVLNQIVLLIFKFFFVIKISWNSI